jgi:fructokinase
MEDRWQSRGEQLPEDHPCWELEASYLAYGLSNIALMFSPHRIILGGGVMKHAPLLDMVRQRVSRTLAGYIKHPALEDDLSGFIVAPALHDRSGVLGALALALEICGN